MKKLKQRERVSGHKPKIKLCKKSQKMIDMSNFLIKKKTEYKWKNYKKQDKYINKNEKKTIIK